MRPLPPIVLRLLDTLPEETCKVILNTNRRGHWEVEVFTRYSLDEEALQALPLGRPAPAQPLASSRASSGTPREGEQTLT